MWQWSGGGGATNGIDGFNGDLLALLPAFRLAVPMRARPE
jgi:hypothetical protein